MNDPALSQLRQTDKTLQMFNKTQLKPLGVVKIETVNPKNDDSLMLEFVVVSQGHMAILGAQAIQQFQLMTVNGDYIMSVDFPPAQSDLILEFSDVFEGEGMLQEKLHLQVDKLVPPVVLPVRKVPFALRESQTGSHLS